MHGVGIQEMRGIGKLRFGTDPTVDTTKPVDAGMVSVFTAASPMPERNEYMFSHAQHGVVNNDGPVTSTS